MTGSNSLCLPVLRIPLKANLDPDPCCCDHPADPDPTFYFNGYPDPDPDPVPHQIVANLRPLVYKPSTAPL
jgi:hypothetical protein